MILQFFAIVLGLSGYMMVTNTNPTMLRPGWAMFACCAALLLGGIYSQLRKLNGKIK